MTVCTACGRPIKWLDNNEEPWPAAWVLVTNQNHYCSSRKYEGHKPIEGDTDFEKQED